MRAVMLSVQPKWCELIESGEKTIEVRKTKPKLETPFKCYLYCTNKKPFLTLGIYFRNQTWKRGLTPISGYGRTKAEELWDLFNGKVIGEFTCNKIENIEIRHFTVFGHENRYAAIGENPDYQWLKKSCLSENEVVEYGKHAPLYGWHISNLVIYETPKELGEFYRHDSTYDNCFGWMFEDRPKNYPIKRPPQSWCYVEEKEMEE